MELSDEERYAVASLFTLALHATQYDAGAGGSVTLDAWGEPPAVERDPRQIGSLSEAELEAWWGYDLVAPGGLLDRVFREMGLPATKWKGLKLLPTAAPSASDETFRQMVRGLIDMLDPELAAALPPLLPRRTPSRLGSRSGSGVDAAGDQQQQDGGAGDMAGAAATPASPGSAEKRAAVGSLFEGLCTSDSEDDSDEDWRADLEREAKLQASAERQRRPVPAPLARRVSQEAEELARLGRLSMLPDEPSSTPGADRQQQQQQDVGQQQQQDGEQQRRQLEGIAEQPQDEEREQRDAQAPLAAQQQEAQQVQHTPVPQRRPGSAEVVASPKAMGAVWELVQCCVGAMPLPPDRQDPLMPPLPRAIDLRWYDARARVALLQVASWLQVPARKVANLELLLTQDKAPRHKALSSVEEDAWARRMRYLKVGAAAVGGGALFAVTGGLAAPAIAAGMGSILGFIGAPTAIASTVTGFLASTAGAATVTTTMAASGAASTGSKMAYRTAEISEFGFRELLPQAPQALPLPEPAKPQQAQQGQQEVEYGAVQAQQQAEQRAADKGSLSGDVGHLHIQAAGGYQAARAQALRRGTSASSLRSCSSGSLAIAGPQQQGAPLGATAEQQQQQQEAQPSAWQRWFGGGGKKEEEEKLLPVPMRSKQGGDVKLAVCIYVAGWIADRSDFDTTWAGCVPESSDAGGCRECRGAGQLLYLQDSCAAMRPKLAVGQCMRAWSTVLPLPSNLPVLLPCPPADSFTLVWETKVLLHLNSALGKLLTMQAAGQSLQLATHSFFYAGAGLVAALGPTVLLGTASGLLISNAWAVASDRAVKAGKLLAHLLLSGAHGDRPVRLVAHGMGARLVFHCLLELCRQGARGVVQHAVLMGCPVRTEELRWRMARRAVAGRLVNCYTRKDWLLGVMAGGSTGWMRATAGLVPIEMAGVENVNLTNLVVGHFAYIEEMTTILDMLHLG